MRAHFSRWGAIWILVVLWLSSWVGQAVFQWQEFASGQSLHGVVATGQDFLPAFLSATLENLQSEWAQLIFQGAVLLGFKHVLFRADAEDLERIERKLDLLLSGKDGDDG